LRFVVDVDLGVDFGMENYEPILVAGMGIDGVEVVVKIRTLRLDRVDSGKAVYS